MHISIPLITFVYRLQTEFLMDIVSRLKIFMNHIGISSSQFADTSLIPRPTLSQLLTGRNKKVSDELIKKIHDAFPSLSIAWLLFGEGDMVVNTNNPFSEAQNFQLPSEPNDITSDSQEFTHQIDLFQNVSDFSSDNFLKQEHLPLTDMMSNTIKEHQTNQNKKPSNTPLHQSKRITNIVVFYDDNSFESFSPS